MVATHTALLALAAQRTSLAPAARLRWPLVVGAVLSAWLAWATLAVNENVIVPEPAPTARIVQQPFLLLAMTGFVAGGMIALFASKSLRSINAAMPSAWPVAAQTYRVAGVMFLWPFLARGAVPVGFAIPAGVGDVLTGLAAPLVAIAVARNRPGTRRLAVAWNWFGILDLMVAPAAAVLAGSTNVARFPLVIVPLFLGPPLGILTHVWSLRNLRQHTQPAAEPMTARAVAASM
jgi:hypothetical protein